MQTNFQSALLPFVARESLTLRLITVFIHDADTKFTAQLDAILESQDMRVHRPTTRSPNLTGYAERWVQSIKRECLNHFIVPGEAHLWHLVEEYLAHYHEERPHQGKNNAPLSGTSPPLPVGQVSCHERLGGLLRHYARRAAQPYRLPSLTCYSARPEPLRTSHRPSALFELCAVQRSLTHRCFSSDITATATPAFHTTFFVQDAR